MKQEKTEKQREGTEKKIKKIDNKDFNYEK